MFVRSPYNYDADVVSHRCGLDCSADLDRAQQHFRDECDINVMVARFARTGMPPPPPQMPSPVDFDSVFDFQSAMQVLIDAKAGFMTLPSKVRREFDNDPSKFLAFVQDDANRDEAIRLGLIPKPVVVPQQPVVDVDDPSSSK